MRHPHDTSRPGFATPLRTYLATAIEILDIAACSVMCFKPNYCCTLQDPITESLVE